MGLCGRSSDFGQKFLGSIYYCADVKKTRVGTSLRILQPVTRSLKTAKQDTTQITSGRIPRRKTTEPDEGYLAVDIRRNVCDLCRV